MNSDGNCRDAACRGVNVVDLLDISIVISITSCVKDLLFDLVLLDGALLCGGSSVLSTSCEMMLLDSSSPACLASLSTRRCFAFFIRTI